MNSADVAFAGPPRVWPLLRWTFWFGMLIVALFFGAFGTWAAIAPLSSGAIASGIVSPDSSRKVIQHLEGGIVRTIHVRENQRVAVGDPLITLESARATASVSSSRGRWLRLLVVRARLDAHDSGNEIIELPAAIKGVADPELLSFVANQQHLFETQHRTLIQQDEIYARRIEQFESEIQSLEAEIASFTTQKGLIDTDLANVEKLLEQQLVAMPQVSALRREQARLQGVMASSQSSIARARQSIEETKLSILQGHETFRIQIADEATQVNNEIAVLEQELGSGEDVLRRTEILSPVNGIVLNLRAKTVGGVVLPGEPIMDVVPTGDDMIVVARLAPRDIELVTIGLQAHVSLLPFASRNLLPLNGTVIEIAADSTLDEATRQHYYEIRVNVPASELAKHENLYMSPGMPADVTIVTGTRTMLQYLAEPMLRAIRNAFIYD